MALTKSLKEIISADRTGLLGKHQSWERVLLRDIAEVLNGYPFESKRFGVTDGFPLIRIRDVVTGTTETFYDGAYDEGFVVHGGDFLVGMDGDFHCSYWASTPALLNQRVCKISPNELFYSKKLLGYALPGFLKAINDETSSVTVKHLSSRSIEEIELPLPPFGEQLRIVEKIEELLSDLDAAVAELNAAQKKVGKYRQSLLKAAVEGSLTAPWRDQQRKKKIKHETGAQLLERILRERRARWEQKQLAKFNEQSKTPPKGWQDKYPEPVKPDTTDLPELPKDWAWASLGQLLETITSGSRDWAPYYDRGTCVFVMAQNVRPWRADFSFRQFVDPPLGNRDRTRSAVEKDDLLITIVGANTGQSCRIADNLESHFVCQSVALLRLTDISLSEFVNAVLNSAGHGQRQFREMNYGAGRPHLSFDQVESVQVPLPPAREQQEIIRAIELALTSVDDIETQIRQAANYSKAQRQNILKAAFLGQLVPQDPNDEPASVLLERIRAERAAREVKKKKPTTRKHKERV